MALGSPIFKQQQTAQGSRLLERHGRERIRGADKHPPTPKFGTKRDKNHVGGLLYGNLHVSVKRRISGNVSQP